MELQRVASIMQDTGTDWCLFVPGAPVMVPWQEAAVYLAADAFPLLRPPLAAALPGLVAPGVTRAGGPEAAGLAHRLRGHALLARAAPSAAALYPAGILLPATAGTDWAQQRRAIAGLAEALAAWCDEAGVQISGISILAV